VRARGQVFVLPRAEVAGLGYRITFNLNQHFESRILPLSTLGLGHAGTVKQLINVAGLYLMETNGDEQFHEVRNQVVGFTSDQGAEKDIGEGTVLVIPRYRHLDPAGTDSFMYLRCLSLPGHLHILYSA
jgi:hypothetical protein